MFDLPSPTAPAIAMIGMREIALIGVVVFLLIMVLPPIVKAIERRRDL